MQSTEVTINEKQYKLTKLPAIKAEEAVMRLAKIMGPVVAGNAKLDAEVKERHQLDNLPKEKLTALSTAFQSAATVMELSQRLTVEDLRYFTQMFMPQTEVMADEGFVSLKSREAVYGLGGPFDYDMSAKFKWLFESLKYNFESFLSGLGSIAGLG